MTEDQFITRLIDQDDRLRDMTNSTYLDAQKDNIKQMRNLIIQFIAISAATIGFTIPVFGNTDLVKSNTFLAGGLAELLIVVIYGFWYLTRLLQKENNELAKQFSKMSTMLDQQRDSRNKFFADIKNPESFKTWQSEQMKVVELLNKEPQNKKQLDYSLDIIFSAFFIGLLLLVFSIFIKI